jgi:hypothetical protein
MTYADVLCLAIHPNHERVYRGSMYTLIGFGLIGEKFVLYTQ